MSDAHKSSDDTESREQRKARYEELLRTVELNTGDPQPPGARRPQILGSLARAGHPTDKAKAALQAAVENEDLLRYTGPEGRTRYALTTDEMLLAVIEAETTRPSPDQEIIAECNQLRFETDDTSE